MKKVNGERKIEKVVEKKPVEKVYGEKGERKEGRE